MEKAFPSGSRKAKHCRDAGPAQDVVGVDSGTAEFGVGVVRGESEADP
jgi:hypothetical protein